MPLRPEGHKWGGCINPANWDANSAMLIGALSFVVFGSKLLFIGQYGSPVPYWDQWDGEAAFLYVPYLDGNLTWASLFDSHNEHRIFFTRVLALGLLNLAGRWDPVLQMIVNAGLHTATVVLLTGLLFRVLPSKDHRPLAILSAITFSLPIGWENLFAGFQSQFYFLMIFSIGCFALTISSRAFSLAWLLGFLLAVAAYFSLSSGTFTFFVVAAIVAMQIWSGERVGRNEWISVVVFLVAGFTCLVFVRTVEAHAPLKAHNVSEFLRAFISLAGFPFSAPFHPVFLKLLLVPVVVGPAIVLSLRALRRTPGADNLWLLIAIFLFAMLQVVSVSYGRAQGFFASRYLDLLLLLLPVGFAMLCRLGVGNAVQSAWLVGATTTLIHFSITSSAPQIVERGRQTGNQFQNVRTFVATSDMTALQNKPFLDIPYPSAERLAMLLSMPQVRSILPTELRPSDDRSEGVIYPRLARLINGMKSILLKASSLIFSFGIAILIFWAPRGDRLAIGHWK